MKFSHILLSLIVASAGTALAATPAKQGPTQLEKVTAVTADTITVQTRATAGLKQTIININGEQTSEKPSNIVTYHVSVSTDIVVDGLPSKLSDVQPGMRAIVDADMNPTDAARIIADTIPPSASPAPKKKVAAAVKGGATPRAAFRKITVDKVLSISADRITVAQEGAPKAKAYLISAMTNITVNGKPGAATDIEKGMSVYITAGDQYTAGSIQATEEDK